MYNEQYDDCPLMDEFAYKIVEMIQKEVENRIGQTVSELHEYRDKYTSLRSEYYKIQREKNQLELKIKKELDAALKQKELEVKRNFAKGYAVNDIVYYKKSIQNTEKCNKCDGTGKVNTEVLGKMVEVKCPHCHYGKIISYTYTPQKDSISSINFWYSKTDRYDTKSSGELKWEFKIWLHNYDNQMDEANLYKTLDECQLACDEKNMK